MAKTLSGEFFSSSSIRKYVPISEFIYSSALTTAGEVVAVLVLSLVAAGLYGFLASKWSDKLRGKVMLFLALVAAVSFAVPLMLYFEMLLYETETDVLLEQPFVVSVLVASIPVSAALVFVFEGLQRRSGRVDLGRPYESFLRLAAGRGFSAVIPIFLVYAVSCVLLADVVAFRSDGLGKLVWAAILQRDPTVMIACMFVVAVMLLTLLLFVDLLAIHASQVVSRRFNSSSPDSKEAATTRTVFLEGVTRPAASDLLRAFRRSGVGMLAVTMLVVMLAVGLLAPLLSTVQDPEDYSNREPNFVVDGWINPLPPSFTPSPYTGFTHPLGTDHRGGDVYSLLLYDTLGSTGAALLFALLSFVVGIGVSFLRATVKYFGGSARKAAGWFGWLLSDALLAVPIFLVLAAVSMTRGPGVLFLVAFFVFVCASFGKGQAASLLLSSPPPKDHGPPFKALSASEVLHVGKYCFLFCFSSIALAGFFIPSSVEWLSVGWVDMLESAYHFGAFYLGSWWTVLPPMVMIGLVAASVFAVMDRLERILHSWSIVQETGPLGVHEGSDSQGLDAPI
jgi:ABC-type dipeptide/oligopeptide/nickel transport system permease subunit